MKKILYIIVIVALLPLYSGCSREYVFDLEEISTNNNNSGNSNSNNNNNNNSSGNNNNNGSGTINGHEYVDLGLSVKWATCNVGANAPEDYGDYYAWGETSTKSSYTLDNSETTGEDVFNIKGTSRDVARVKWGGTWCMPSRTECEELEYKCKWATTIKSGINGYKITGPNGNSIFLPAAGYRGGTYSYEVGVKGHYWCSTSSDGYSLYGWTIFFNNTYYNTTHSSMERYGGLPIRPVTK